MSMFLFQQYLRVLFAEDDDDFKSDVIRLIQKRFPQILIDEASTRETLRQKLNDSKDTPDNYNVIILDVQMPEKTGGILSRDISFAKDLITFNRDGSPWLVFLTSYIEDTSLAPYREMARNDRDLCMWFLSKRDTEYPFQLDRILQQAAAEKALGRWLDDSAFIEMRSQTSALYQRNPQGTDFPVNLPAFVTAVIEHWSLLLPRRKRQTLDTLKDSPWELVETEEDGPVQLTNAATAERFRESRELARLLGVHYGREESKFGRDDYDDES